MKKEADKKKRWLVRAVGKFFVPEMFYDFSWRERTADDAYHISVFESRKDALNAVADEKKRLNAERKKYEGCREQCRKDIAYLRKQGFLKRYNGIDGFMREAAERKVSDRALDIPKFSIVAIKDYDKFLETIRS